MSCPKCNGKGWYDAGIDDIFCEECQEGRERQALLDRRRAVYNYKMIWQPPIDDLRKLVDKYDKFCTDLVNENMRLIKELEEIKKAPPS